MFLEKYYKQNERGAGQLLLLPVFRRSTREHNHLDGLEDGGDLSLRANCSTKEGARAHSANQLACFGWPAHESLCTNNHGQEELDSEICELMLGELVALRLERSLAQESKLGHTQAGRVSANFGRSRPLAFSLARASRRGGHRPIVLARDRAKAKASERERLRPT